MQRTDRPLVACTIAARNYLAQANILARSFQRHHPEAHFAILVVDQLGEHETRSDGVELLGLDEIGLDPGESHRMPLIYDVTELSTAVKPWLLRRLSDSGANVVIYFDPDIEIFGRLDDVAELAREHSIVLTPHVTEPMPRDQLRLSETDILSSGIYNLGFIAVGPGSDEFLGWWATRLRREAVIDPTRMRFTDQRWIDFVPGLFRHFILRDESCNVAYWNLYSRRLTWRDDHYEVNGKPLRFFHYSGYEPGKPHILSKHQGNRPRILLSDHPGVAKICGEYRAQLLAGGFEERKASRYGFDLLPGGLKMDRHIRRAYRDALLDFEEGRGEEPPDPFRGGEEERFLEWLNEPITAEPALVTRYMFALHRNRTDLQRDFPHPLAADAAAFRVWFLQKAETEERVPRVLVPQTKREASPTFAPSRQDKRTRGNENLTVVGYFKAELGVGEASRLLVAALRAGGVLHQTLRWDDTISRQEHPFEDAKSSQGPSDINIVCINADRTPHFANRIGSPFFDGRYTIGVWFWEVEEFPAILHNAFNFVDEIWVATDFMREAIAKVSPHPVFKFPLPIVAPLVDPALTREDLGLSERFTFLYSFDFMSVLERKNPLGLIEAFTRAFIPGEGPVLVIKTINGSARVADLERLKLAAAQHPDVRVIDGYISAVEKNTMTARCDCYVSLHRSEGYGLTMAEAMALGRPVIATGYSGNLDFMTAENSYLCPYQLEPVGEGSAPYPARARWAEPEIDEAARLMRHVHLHREEARARGELAARTVREQHSPESAANVIRQRISEIRTVMSERAAGRQRSDSSSVHFDQLGAALDEIQTQLIDVSDCEPARAALASGAHLSLAAARERLEQVRALHRYVETDAEKSRARLAQADREIWALKAKRADATARALALDEQLRIIRESGLWKSIKPLWKLVTRKAADVTKPARDLLFEVEEPENWETEREKIIVAGWCFSRSRELVGVRVRVGRKGQLARYGIERFDVASGHDQMATARLSGFQLEVRVPRGTTRISLDCVAQGERWQEFFTREIVASAS